MTAPAPVTDVQIQAVRDALATGLTKNEATASVGIRRCDLDRLMKPGRPLAGLRVGRRVRPRSPDPTLAEIEARAAEVRSRWTAKRWFAHTGVEVFEEPVDDVD